MAITIGSNIASLQSQRRLFDTSEKLATVFERLASGQRINRAADDAAGLAISESLNTDRRVFTQAVRNLNDGQSALNIADSTVEELSSIVIRIRELATQSANGSLSNQQRESLDTEAQELRDEFFRVSREAEFNGLRLFDGSLEEGLRLQGGYGVDGSIFSSLGGVLGDGTFGSIQTLSTPTTLSRTIATGDFNNDGSEDFIYALSASIPGQISYFFTAGNGDGTFQDAVSLGDGGTGSAGRIDVADVNNDGNLDFLVTDVQGFGTSHTLRSFLGDGNGGFSEAQAIVNAPAGQDFDLGDLNGDGFLDLVMSGTNSSNEFDVRFNLGDGTFGEKTTNSIAAADQLTLSDLNGDGILDLVTIGNNTSGEDIIVQFGNGDGSFGGEVSSNFLDGASFLSIGNFDVADINGDGIEDIVASGFLPGTNPGFASILGNGDGTFSSVESYDTGGSFSSTQLADVNGDGILDVIEAISSDTIVYSGLGDGTFGSGVTFSGIGAADNSLALADFDSDGVLDAVGGTTNSFNFSKGGTREGINPLLEFSLSTQAGALQALAPLENKLNSLTAQRGVIGAFQSRLDTAVNTLQATTENYAAAESRIRDADIAAESANLTRLNILRQAAASVLAQANQQPALSLLLLS